MKLGSTTRLIAAAAGLYCSLSTASVQDPAQLRTAAENAFSNGETELAMNLYSKLIKVQPNDERNYYKRFRVYLSERKYQLALQDLTLALEVNPQYKQALLQLGRLHYMLGQCANASVELEKLLKLSSNDETAAELLAKTTACVENLDQAERAQSAGDYEVAVTYLNYVLDDPTVSSAKLLMERAQLSMSLDNYYDTIADLGSVLRLDPSNLSALQLRGQALYRIGDPASLEAALSHYRQGLHSDPEHKGLKSLYRQLKKLLKFIKNAERQMSEEAYEEASETLNTAIASVSAHDKRVNIDLYLQLCTCELKREAHASARAACDSVLELDSENAAALAQQSQILIGLEEYEDAVRLAKKAYELEETEEYAQYVQRAETALKQSKEKDYYKILQVPRTASQQKIKKSYRKLALVWHPDKHSDKTEEEKEKIMIRFRNIAEAYEILSDEETRAKYDRGEDVTGNQPQQQHPFSGGGFPFGGGSQFFQQGGRTFHFQFN